MHRILFLCLFCLISFSASSRGENFLTYIGTVNGNTSVFYLCWIGDNVVGTFARDSTTCTIAGDNSRQGEMFMSVAYLGRTVGHIKVRKKPTEGKVTWTGSMRIEETGSIVPVTFSREKKS